VSTNTLNQAGSYQDLKGQTSDSFFRFDETQSVRISGLKAQSNLRGLKGLRQQKDALREHTMRRIDSMGFKTPLAWKDELYRNELRKLDMKRELMKNQGPGQAVIEDEFKDDIDGMNSTYFDRVYQENCQTLLRAKTAQKSTRSTARIPNDAISCSGAKNLRLLRDQGKIRVLNERQLQLNPRGSRRSELGKKELESSTTSSKLADLLKSRAEMREVEKVIITKEDAIALQQEKHEHRTKSHFCGRCMQNQTLVQLNKQLLNQERIQRKASRALAKE